jgi:hypothetical protein
MRENFPVKLFDILSHPKNADMVSWTDGGMTFTIRDPIEYEKHCLPQLSDTTTYKTFVRQLNLYGYVIFLNIFFVFPVVSSRRSVFLCNLTHVYAYLFVSSHICPSPDILSNRFKNIGKRFKRKTGEQKFAHPDFTQKKTRDEVFANVKRKKKNNETEVAVTGKKRLSFCGLVSKFTFLGWFLNYFFRSLTN